MPSNIPNAAAIANDARLAWQRGLTEKDCRELASEYLRGRIDDSTTDAFEEFERRYGKQTTVSGHANKAPRKLRRGR